MTLISPDCESAIARTCSSHLADLARRSVKRARREPFGSSQLAVVCQTLELLVLELEDREEWKIAEGLRRAIARTPGLQI